ncbi:MAG: hypothetical protein ACI85O_000454 [Saprospiraceae bacterium]|jgi:hypothetical protein
MTKDKKLAISRKSKSTGKKQSALVLKVGLIASLLLIISFLACNSDSREKIPGDLSKQFSLLPASYTGITFENFVEETTNRGLLFFENFYAGAGVAIGDVNNDGLPDVFFTGNDAPNSLYINKGNFKFEDISKEAGIQNRKWGTGVSMVDINKDGWLDIYVCNSDPSNNPDAMRNELYINNGNNTFTEQAASYGIADNSRSVQATFFDMDMDGDLDLWVVNNAFRGRALGAIEWYELSETLDPVEYNRECSTLYRNEGNGQFTDISKEAGIQKIGFGLGIAVNDFDQDGLLDVYITNDYFVPDFMFLNNGDGTFTDKIDTKLSHTSYFAMGCDAADFNNDGLTDLAVLDMTPADHVRNKVLMASMGVSTFRYLTETKKYTPQYMMNSLCINNGFGIMSDIGLFAGVSQTDWSWAPLFVDIDNDGFKDFMVTNGFKKDTKNNDWLISLNELRESKGKDFSTTDYFEHLKKADVTPVPNSIFKNTNGLNFEEKTEEWGFSTPSFSNGAAYADLDQDGDLDLVINNFDQPAFIYRNNSREREEGHFIQVKLKDGKIDNTVLHSKVNIYYGDKMQSADYVLSRGYQSSVEPIAHFGLGKQNEIDSLIIFWNDGKKSIILNPKINQTHIINKQKTPVIPIKKEQVIPLFANISARYLHPQFKHQENSYNDFQKEILLPHSQSRLGPAVAVGDVNGDQLEDFYIGGAKNQYGVLYIQDNNGHFNARATNAFEKSAPHEDTGAKFIDIDGDKDLDLYVASGGGGDLEGEEKLLQDRLYLNDGKGNFVHSKNRLPKMETSTKAITEIDWDKDGDLDIFVGGRTSPGKYPLAPKSYLLVNNNGTFTNQTKALAPELEDIGMITAAEWTDTDKDGNMDLLIVGEWMPITLFKNTGNGFENKTNSLGIKNTKGWWSSLLKSDIDQDGDDDFIVGNIGLNNKFHPTKEKPLYIYANDFDNNGQMDIVLSKIYNGQKVPVRGKECSTQQMPFLAEKFPTYEGFATASLEDIYEEDQLSNAIQYEANNFSSVYLENKGNGTFEMSLLPKEAQLAPINGIIAKDFDKDGIKDLIIAGSLKQTEVETPLYDAGKGLFLKGLGDGTFTSNLEIEYSGLFLHRDVKDVALIHVGSGSNKLPGFLVLNNNDVVELIVYRK